MLDIPRRAALLARYADGNAEIARRYFHRETLFDETMPAPHPGDGGESVLTPPSLARILGWLMLQTSNGEA
jgi:hypothetical protein